MRKLDALQVGMLVSGLIIGNDNAFSSETAPIEEITITGTIYPSSAVYVTLPTPYTQTPNAQYTQSQSASAATAHQIACAKAYAGKSASGTPGSHAGSAPGFKTYLANDYGWTNNVNYAGGTTPAPPSGGGPWTAVKGFTYRYTGSSEISIIYIMSATATGSSGTKTGDLINTYAHALVSDTFEVGFVKTLSFIGFHEIAQC